MKKLVRKLFNWIFKEELDEFRFMVTKLQSQQEVAKHF